MDASTIRQRGETVLEELSRAVIVEEDVLRIILTGVMADGHVLLEDVPGTGKTLTARSFATVLGLSFNRIQFTPDLLPADVTGTFVFNERSREFEFSEGPLFANVVLADEINRASPKTQAALLEAMEEGQVTVDGETFPLPDPFFVIATQNPVERGEGTFPLPEAQKDRFLVKSSIGYPDEAGELELLDRRSARETSAPEVSRQFDPDDLRTICDAPEQVRVHDDVKQYVVDLVRGTREDGRVDVGVSPRGCQRLFEVARAWAAVAGRDYVTPDDVADVAHPVLDHRLVLTADATVNDVARETVVDDLLDEISVPTIRRKAAP